MEEQEAPVWYFAFGANMATRVLRGRRGIAPRQSRAACVRGWRVGFVEAGFPPIEPVFAGLLEAPGATAWGVLHLLEARDAARLDDFEGPGYARVRLEARPREGAPVEAFAYATTRPVEGRRPSRRYLRLLLDGEREHGLPAETVAALEAQETVHVPVLSALLPATLGLVETVLRAVHRVQRWTRSR